MTFEVTIPDEAIPAIEAEAGSLVTWGPDGARHPPLTVEQYIGRQLTALVVSVLKRHPPAAIKAAMDAAEAQTVAAASVVARRSAGRQGADSAA